MAGLTNYSPCFTKDFLLFNRLADPCPAEGCVDLLPLLCSEFGSLGKGGFCVLLLPGDVSLFDCSAPITPPLRSVFFDPSITPGVMNPASPIPGLASPHPLPKPTPPPPKNQKTPVFGWWGGGGASAARASFRFWPILRAVASRSFLKDRKWWSAPGCCEDEALFGGVEW